MSACQSYERGHAVCRDGFPVKPICAGLAKPGCFSCGHVSEKATPYCQIEDFDHRGFVAEDGSMKLRRNK